MGLDCWKCPINRVKECKEGSEYCERYASTNYEMPNTIREIEEVREKEGQYWDSKNR